MTSELRGLRVAFVTSNEGVEQVELTSPWQAVRDAGGVPELLAPDGGEVRAFNHLEAADSFPVHRTLGDTDHLEFDALVVPGGVANGDFLRLSPAAVTFVQRMFEHGKPAAVICHGPWSGPTRSSPAATPATCRRSTPVSPRSSGAGPSRRRASR